MDESDTIAAPSLVGGVPEGLDALFLARLASGEAAPDGGAAAHQLLHIARDDRRLADLANALSFFAPDVRVISFPAWDCVPYDRVSPHPAIVARRISALARLAAAKPSRPTIVLTTVNGALQRVPPAAFIKRGIRAMAPGRRADIDRLARWLEAVGYVRTSTVMEPGEYAVRGGIVDLFPPGRSRPVRLDFFGDTLESIRSFDAETQRTSTPINRLVVLPVTEISLAEKARAGFRSRYVELFGPVTSEDPLYEAVSAGVRFPGMEHWLALYHDGLETLFDYLPGVPVSFDHLAVEAMAERDEQIAEHFAARNDALEQSAFGAPP